MKLREGAMWGQSTVTGPEAEAFLLLPFKQKQGGLCHGNRVVGEL